MRLFAPGPTCPLARCPSGPLGRPRPPRIDSRAPRSEPRAPKTGPRPPKSHPRPPQDPPGATQDLLRPAQDPQERPKTVPRAPKTSPRCPKSDPRATWSRLGPEKCIKIEPCRRDSRNRRRRMFARTWPYLAAKTTKNDPKMTP